MGGWPIDRARWDFEVGGINRNCIHSIANDIISITKYINSITTQPKTAVTSDYTRCALPHMTKFATRAGLPLKCICSSYF